VSGDEGSAGKKKAAQAGRPCRRPDPEKKRPRLRSARERRKREPAGVKARTKERIIDISDSRQPEPKDDSGIKEKKPSPKSAQKKRSPQVIDAKDAQEQRPKGDKEDGKSPEKEKHVIRRT